MADFYKGSDFHDHIQMGEDYIQHWKYVKKQKVGKSTRYFYSWDEWKAFLAGDDSSNNSADLSKQLSVMGSSKRKSQKSESLYNTFKSNPINTIKEKANQGKEWFTNKVKKKDEENKDNKKDNKKEDKKEETKKQPEAVREEGVDDNGHKYIAKVEIDGKTRYFYSEEELKTYQDRAKYTAEEPDFMKNVKHSDVPYTSEEDACVINPNFYKGLEYQTNCTECTAIYELRRRGYDVESNGITGYDGGKYWRYNTEDRFNILYENAQTSHTPQTTTAEQTYSALMNEFNKHPPGSRGDLTFVWAQNGGGHSVVWEKDLKGNVKIVDTQACGTKYHTEYDVKTLSYCMDNASYGPKNTASVTRTDNLKLKKGIEVIYKDSGEKKNKPKGNHIQVIHENWEFNWVTNANELRLSATDKTVKLTNKERQTKYPEIGSAKTAASSKKDSASKSVKSKASQMKALQTAGYSYAEIAKRMGISTSTVAKYL